jgi:nitroimidazol reductase NimA-like FMN-containing flavoprotein (pyridoxamine 5'-phosphate oxidase superfamily)
MPVEHLSRDECLTFLARQRLVRLGCACSNQPYVIPIYIARDGDRLYAFTTPG